MTGRKSSYRQIIKSTSLFGSTQVITILISIIRSKFIAVLLGPGGMGIAGLINATLKLIEGFSGFGLGTSAVKDVAAAHASGDGAQVSHAVGVLRRLVWITGLLGAVLTFFMSPLLSQLTFGNHDYAGAFRWVSVTLLFNQVSVGQGVVLRGLRRLQFLAKASLLGSLAGLLVSVPLYYFHGLKGIVPAIIVSSLLSLILTTYFSAKVKIGETAISFKKALWEGKEMIRLGFMLSLSGLIALGASYIVRIFISIRGGVDQVGLYNAGFAILNTYVGMIFTSMATDYFPRLSGVASNNSAARELMNEQSETGILILAPVLSAFMVFVNWIVLILYSSKFTAVNEMVQWAALGIYFKSASFSMGYIFLAKGASKLFMWNELAANSYILAFNLIGYTLAGLEGLGISFLAGYFVYFLQMFLVSKAKYEFRFSPAFIKIFLIQLSLGAACFTAVKALQPPFSYIVGTIIVMASLGFSYYGIRERIDLKAAVWEIKGRLSKNQPR
ncbi:MAG TPA: O-antigen translocase [Bacteroidales bacterium]|nr:O-antigen translocase [Bacteroidales bacterium]